MKRSTVALVLALAAMNAACSSDDTGGGGTTTGSGDAGLATYTADQAAARCDEEAAAKAGCFSQDSLDQCKACFVQCGDSCAEQAQCPEEYTCP